MTIRFGTSSVLAASLLAVACVGDTGASGGKGADGKSARVVVTAEPAGANCANGGQRIDASVGDGPLTTEYACNGNAGEAGTTGAAGASANVKVDYEPPGANCADGGKRLIVSVGDATPVVSYVCNGAPGRSVVATPFAPNAQCAAGGVELSDGVETRYVCNGRDGESVTVSTLQPGEAAECPTGGAKVEVAGRTTYVCSGQDAHVTVKEEPAGSHCATGGQKIDVSIGTGAATTSYVCDGSEVTVEAIAAGSTCPTGGRKIKVRNESGITESTICSGANGTNAVAVAEPAGANCANGGIKVTSAGSTQYVCNGANGTNGQGVTASSEAPGDNCANGGVKLVSASGTNYVCNGSEGRLLSVNAGADQTVNVGSVVTLAGSVSDKVIGRRWVQLSGPAVTLSDTQSLTPTFTAPDFNAAHLRHVVFQLQANDGVRVETDLVAIKLNHAPNAPTVLLSPLIPQDTDDLICAVTSPANDVDGDTVAFQFTWTRRTTDGIEATLSGVSTSPTTSTLPADLTQPGEHYKCTATAFDGNAGANASAGVIVRPLSNCLQLKQLDPSAPTGAYTIDPDGLGPVAPFNATCDQTNDGGGWTVISWEPTASATGWNNGAITNATVAGSVVPVHGMFGGGEGAAKTFPLLGVGHTQLRIKARYYAVDSWDNEVNGAQLWIDGLLRWTKRKVWNGVGEAPGWVSANFLPAPWGNNNGPNGYWNVESGLGLIGHTTNAVTIQFATGLDQVAADESFAFSHLEVSVR